MYTFSALFSADLPFSVSYNQARALHSSHNPTNVQDPGTQRPNISLHPVGLVPGRYQVERHAGHLTRTFASSLLLIYFKIQGNNAAHKTNFLIYYHLYFSL